MTDHQIATIFFLQLGTLLAACRLVGMVARRFGQPQVVAEMITGVLLGPSLLGAFLPEVQAALFPKASLTIIYVIAQIGLALYMFCVGLEFQYELILRKIRSAAMISGAGILVPFALGAGFAAYAVRRGGLFSPEASVMEAALFAGAAMSITAFPMLARIIYERGIAGTSLGTMALAAGSIDDAAAWTLLAVVLASFKADAGIAAWAIGGGLIYACVVLGFGRRWLRPLGDRVEREGAISKPVLSFVLMLLAVAAWFTDLVGIYSVFGAFMLGVAMPRGALSRELQRYIEPLTTTFLLPLFFVYSGLNTRLGLINTPGLIGMAVLVIVLASVGKGVACAAAARVSGHPVHEALAIGALMNARGLMELIILNLGLAGGLITPTFFTMMVMMAIVTTLSAGPLFELVYRRVERPLAVPAVPA